MKHQLDFSLIVDSIEDTFGHKITSHRIILKLDGKKLRRVKSLSLTANVKSLNPAITVKFDKDRILPAEVCDPMELLKQAFKGFEFVQITQE